MEWTTRDEQILAAIIINRQTDDLDVSLISILQ